RVKNWGRLKITQVLQQKDISAYCIKQGLKEIDEEEYLDTISKLARKKAAELQLRFSNTYQLKDKVSRFLISRGFEPELVWEILKTLS
ncbi:MAG: RecX family transcriptional regulator, partial [Cyclobacteriaceae bacterium]|nr:RecX family transcriptional regulator [Cyclobacteriaceae bacterium]